MSPNTIIKSFVMPEDYVKILPFLQLEMGQQRGPFRTTRGDWGYRKLSASMVMSDALACLFLAWYEHIGPGMLQKSPLVMPEIDDAFWRAIDASVVRATPIDREPWEKRAKAAIGRE